jgi:ABC-type lipoprotein export system ATPase subunit
MSDTTISTPSAAGPEQPFGEEGRVPAVELDDVRKYYDGGVIKALNGLSLRIERGESVAVTGPSGCGKSTMLHLIAALDRPTSGIIRVGGVDLAQEEDLPGYRRRHIGLVFQLHNLMPQLSAVQNVEVAMFGTGLSLRRRRARARTLLADVDLAGLETRPPTKLSGGERQRVAIARALANEPELLLADEPTGSLDERSVDLVLDLFARLRNERPGMTMIIVTHDVRVAGTADRIIWLRDGRVDYARTGQKTVALTASPGEWPGPKLSAR